MVLEQDQRNLDLLNCITLFPKTSKLVKNWCLKNALGTPALIPGLFQKMLSTDPSFRHQFEVSCVKESNGGG